MTRLKLVKRQMYGRANVDLLRQRVRHPIQEACTEAEQDPALGSHVRSLNKGNAVHHVHRSITMNDVGRYIEETDEEAPLRPTRGRALNIVGVVTVFIGGIWCGMRIAQHVLLTALAATTDYPAKVQTLQLLDDITLYYAGSLVLFWLSLVVYLGMAGIRYVTHWRQRVRSAKRDSSAD